MNSSILRWIAAIVLALFALSLAVHGADACAEWKESYAAYEDEVDDAIHDEPEDLPKELRRHAEAVANGYTDQAMRIETKIREGLTGLRAIDPDPDLAGFHADLIECYRNGVAVLDAEQRGDGAGRTAAEIRVWRSLRSLMVTVRDFLAARGCDPGDVEAIDQHYLGAIDAEIAALERGSGR